MCVLLCLMSDGRSSILMWLFCGNRRLQHVSFKIIFKVSDVCGWNHSHVSIQKHNCLLLCCGEFLKCNLFLKGLCIGRS